MGFFFVARWILLYLLNMIKIVCIQPKYRQSDEKSCRIHSMFYGTTLLLGKDPNDVKFKFNNGRGDQCLHMRLHVLRMFAIKKSVLFE